MKVLKDNSKTTATDTIHNTPKIVKSIKTTCMECGSELEIEKEDIYDGAFGGYWVNCPCCNDATVLSDQDEEALGLKHLTVDDTIYPKHFYISDGYVADIKDDEINKKIQALVNRIRNNKDENDTIAYTYYGNVFIFVQKFDGDEEYFIMVSKDYKTTEMDFNDIDYR